MYAGREQCVGPLQYNLHKQQATKVGPPNLMSSWGENQPRLPPAPAPQPPQPSNPLRRSGSTGGANKLRQSGGGARTSAEGRAALGNNTRVTAAASSSAGSRNSYAGQHLAAMAQQQQQPQQVQPQGGSNGSSSGGGSSTNDAVQTHDQQMQAAPRPQNANHFPGANKAKEIAMEQQFSPLKAHRPHLGSAGPGAGVVVPGSPADSPLVQQAVSRTREQLRQQRRTADATTTGEHAAGMVGTFLA